MEQNNDELESFRRQWREEVSARFRGGAASQPKQQQPAQKPPSAGTGHKLPPRHHPAADRIEEEELETTGETSLSRKPEELVDQMRTLHVTSADDDSFHRQPEKELTSALEHFEAAAQKEAQGSLGTSLDLYRKAYRLDSKVDQAYRKKHFPPPAFKVAGINPPYAPVTVPGTGHHSQKGPVLSTPDLIASFAACPIPGAAPIIENTPPPPCPISKMPSEVLVEILWHVALLDPSSFGRLSLVCKRLAYHFAREQHIWRRLCQGSEFGFETMHYDFSCDIKWHRIHSFLPKFTPFPFDRAHLQIPEPLSSWSQVFQTFPRIRFTGIYISTVNYTRPGANSALQNISWNTPIHIVTYYRYLRFYPDGSVISLLTTTEPVDVVPHISKESLETLHVGMPAHRRHQHHTSDTTQIAAPVANPIPPVAAAALRSSLRGRWHLNNPYPPPPVSEEPGQSSGLPAATEAATITPTPPPCKQKPASLTNSVAGGNNMNPDPRDLFIETEGPDSKYTYVMHLALRSTSSGRAVGDNAPPPSNPSKNTKLMWKGFWSYNRLTDDWAEFGLRNDRAFVFRRVRGWGMP
ncbi:hypothetical protein AJ79_00005 [Helicocarpus griseus UAMH5409]|uniref:F-box domain-containing protein n=1 Tax=Helicocarpus griseus UAMH5409 TaxID=1447875 RepID=A0A2B7YDM0_9EURO|nr:hypothetical protein AJ79_00005 [Helicocarpus griseus UAMH5409]